MEYKDYYKTLGLDKKASEKEIQKAYKNLAKKYHPDVNKAKGAEAKFKELNEAYEVLGDKDKKQKYDTLGSNWNQYENAGNYAHQDMGDIGGKKFYGGDFSDFFETIFGSSSKSQSANSFGSILSGMGFGGQQNNQQKTRQKTQQHQQPHQEHKKIEAQEIEVEVSIEEVYEGSKKLMEIGEKKIEVSIPRGIDEGHKIRIKGSSGNDIHLKIKIKKHDLFKLEGKNIIYEVPVVDYDAIFGIEVTVPTISGSSVTLKIPQMTQSGKSLRLKNLGLPNRKTEERGDMFVKAKIMIPKDLSEKEKSLYQEIKDLRNLKDKY